MEEKKDGRGGARPGAGRPKGVKKPYAHLCFSLPVEYSEKLKAMAKSEGLSVSKLIQRMIDGAVKKLSSTERD